uniref:Uncharacterized protein n=1 Tax=Candidatus Kentrum sp. LPFa TaxID=2126335 RepID=A0A450WR07_9GAMM|nr:MAG: hypothetical protein BECKLPF1236B_GA0070989_11734 [Candidatus Kentron sp. LPFa]
MATKFGSGYVSKYLVDLWTSPLDRPSPFRTCGQPGQTTFLLPTACLPSSASRLQGLQWLMATTNFGSNLSGLGFGKMALRKFISLGISDRCVASCVVSALILLVFLAPMVISDARQGGSHFFSRFRRN